MASMWIAWLSWRLPPGSRRCRSVRPDETGIGAQPERRAELGVGGEPVDAGDLSDQLCGDEDPEAFLGQQSGTDPGDHDGEMFIETGDRAGQLAQAVDHVAGDLDLDRGWGPTQALHDGLLPAGCDQHPPGDGPVGPEVMQLPAQLVDQ